VLIISVEPVRANRLETSRAIALPVQSEELLWSVDWCFTGGSTWPNLPVGIILFTRNCGESTASAPARNSIGASTGRSRKGTLPRAHRRRPPRWKGAFMPPFHGMDNRSTRTVVNTARALCRFWAMTRPAQLVATADSNLQAHCFSSFPQHVRIVLSTHLTT
jgi:hypothetical protein